MILETIEQGVEYCIKFRDPLAEAEDCVIKASISVVKAEEGIPRQVAMGRLEYWVRVYQEVKEDLDFIYSLKECNTGQKSKEE